MKLATPFNALKMQILIFEECMIIITLPKEAKQNYGDKEYIDHPK